MRTVLVFFVLFMVSLAFAGEKNKKSIKFYNFDDLLINGEYRRPQVLWVDSRQKVKFEKLLKLRKDFIPKLEKTGKDPSLK